MRRLIVCADGTWNRPDEAASGARTPTNVVKTARAITPVDSRGVSQIVYYHPGVGTHDTQDKLFGGAFGKGLEANIRSCYRFLVQNYAPGDELYMFGFSRGAYTVRSLAGLIRNSGVLRTQHAEREEEAFGQYRARGAAGHPNSESAREFRATYSHDLQSIACIGVWDTVGALGLPIELFDGRSHSKYRFHDLTLSARIKNAFHALAIDEHRKPFRPTLWEQPTEDLDRNWLEQAWFCGAHANVGGGYPDCSLSDLTLDWMIGRVTDRSGLEFDRDIARAMMRPSPTGQLHNSLGLAYKVIGRLERQIDDAALANSTRGVSTWEYVHESVRQRIDALAHKRKPYRPKNLSNYLVRSQPEPRTSRAARQPAEPESQGESRGTERDVASTRPPATSPVASRPPTTDHRLLTTDY